MTEDDTARMLAQMARQSTAFETVASAVATLAKIEQDRYDREYPRRQVKEATLATASYKKKAPEQEEDTGPVSDLFPEVGPREAALLKKRRKTGTL